MLRFNHRKFNQIFSSRADDQCPSLLNSNCFKNGIFCLISLFSPKVRAVVEKTILVADLKKDGMIGFSFNDQGIITGPAEGEGDLSPGIGFRVDACLRRSCEDGIAAGAEKGGICQGTQGEDKAILRRKGIDMGWIFFKKEEGTQPLASEIRSENRFGDRFDRRLLLGEIDSEKSIKKSLHNFILKEIGRTNQDIFPLISL